VQNDSEDELNKFIEENNFLKCKLKKQSEELEALNRENLQIKEENAKIKMDSDNYKNKIKDFITSIDSGNK